MIYTILIIIMALWFFVSATIFQKKLSKKYPTAGERMKAYFTQIPYVMFMKRDKELTPWVIQAWVSFMIALILVLMDL